jgi:photosystem II 10kDa protein
VQANLMGISRKMKDKNWVDSQGRKGKGYGVYKFADKYGVSRKLKV